MVKSGIMADEEPPEARAETKVPNTIGEAMGATANAALNGVDIDVVAVLGTADLKISQVLQLGRGAVLELDRMINEPIEICAERQLVARGEVVIIEDKLAIQLTEVVPSSRSK
jgi:flagellar motor switch protein FliN/FliY